jgi:hypothetical protein
MAFSKRKKILGQKSNEYELLRFCSKLNNYIIGGVFKLFKYFINNYKPSKIISYVNCDINDGALYKIIGFNEIGHSGINYWWTDGNMKYHRNNFMKHKTEGEIMKEHRYYKIYGSGNLKYEWNNPS